MVMKNSKKIKFGREALWVENAFGNRMQGFQNLMKYRIRDILLVSSLYDLYLFEEDGRLYELIRNEYQGLNLTHSPDLTRVSSGQEAMRMINDENRFDLIITTMHIEDMHVLNFAKMIRQSGLTIPIVLLAHDNSELKLLLNNPEKDVFNKIFTWTGDFRIILGIIKYLEDIKNIENDGEMIGVQNIIFIEDNVRHYSSFLPIIYTEVLKQSRQLISEGINLTHKFLRMRARPKILLCSNYEEAWEYYKKYKQLVLGIISDISFPRKNKLDFKAGIRFAKAVKKDHADIPVLLTSDNPENEKLANKINTSFLLKNSPTMLTDFRQFLNDQFGFGDFVFKTTRGKEVGRATDLRSLEECLKVVPLESINFHGSRNHFSNWLKARTEFWLAHQLRPRKISDYPNHEALRQDLIKSLHEYRTIRQRGVISDFDKGTFDLENSLARIGGGSLGGKARGLGFINTLINNYHIGNKFKNIQIYVPPAVILGTEVFDDFLDSNELREFALNCENDEKILKIFLSAKNFPMDISDKLTEFLKLMNFPLAVRSSSLLEDSQYHPFAGVYQTYMIPNNHANLNTRLNDLISTIKKVFASTFYQGAKNYIKVTSYRTEEEKMAVIIQKMIGVKHENRFYPDISGVAKSYNFYPPPHQESSEGVVSVALGLGKTVVEGGNTVRFNPKYPDDLIQFYSVEETLNNSQKGFYSLQLDEKLDHRIDAHDLNVKCHSIDIAEKDGSLNLVGSTYVADNDAIYDGLSRNGPRVVTFGPILKHKLFPLSEILNLLLDLGIWGMGTPIEMEFAINMNTHRKTNKEFGMLQIRPLVISLGEEQLNIEEHDDDEIICRSKQVLGNGIISDIKDIVFVDYNLFERSKSREVAAEVASFNGDLIKSNKPYLLIGVGRWGSLDPWLGIPVKWEQIAGAKAIIETSFKDMVVEPSQGSHFFQNITSFMIGYFTIDTVHNDGFINWEWLLSVQPYAQKKYTKHIRFDKPLIIQMSGHANKGMILKPES
jgi:CheY-like chemotaxis protein